MLPMGVTYCAMLPVGVTYSAVAPQSLSNLHVHRIHYSNHTYTQQISLHMHFNVTHSLTHARTHARTQAYTSKSKREYIYLQSNVPHCFCHCKLIISSSSLLLLLFLLQTCALLGHVGAIFSSFLSFIHLCQCHFIQSHRGRVHVCLAVTLSLIHISEPTRRA